MPKGPNWEDVRDAKRALLSFFPHDDFLKKVAKGAYRAGRDKKNPIRGNLIAGPLREIVTHVLHTLAPDEEVRECDWFVQAKDTPTVTRAQRAQYIVQAGLPTDFVTKELKVDAAAMGKPIVAAMEELHKSTHVKPESMVGKGSAVRAMLYDVFGELHELLDAARDSRKAITEAVADALNSAVFESLIFDTIQELDELSTHSRVDGQTIDTITVKRLDAARIEYHITGEVEVELQYGSNSDVANDIGMRSDDSYPFKAKVRANARKPLSINADMVDFKVDTRSFYD